MMYGKSKAVTHGKHSLKAKTTKLADFSVTGGFDVPDHPPGIALLVGLSFGSRCWLGN